MNKFQKHIDATRNQYGGTTMSSGAPNITSNRRSMSPDGTYENQDRSFRNNQALSNRQFTSLVMTSQEEDNGGGTSRREQAQLQYVDTQSANTHGPGLARQSSYQRILEKYNQKKDRLGSRGRPTDLPLSANKTTMGNNSHRAASGRDQPQYLTYLEKTLEKTDQTIQDVRVLTQQFRQMELKVESIQTFGVGLEDVLQRMKIIEDFQAQQNDENAVYKLLFEAMQAKQKDQDATMIDCMDAIKELKQSDQGQIIQNNQVIIQQALHNIESRVEEVVARKFKEGPGGSGSFEEQKILDLIDSQGKDIAIDFANIEKQVADIEAKIAEGAAQVPDHEQFRLFEERLINNFNQRFNDIQQSARFLKRSQSPLQNKRRSPSPSTLPVQQHEFRYLQNRIESFEKHLAEMSQKQRGPSVVHSIMKSPSALSIKSASRSRSRSQTKKKPTANLDTQLIQKIVDKEVKTSETRMQNKLATTIDKLGQLIKKQEAKVLKLSNRQKEMAKDLKVIYEIENNRTAAITQNVVQTQAPKQRQISKTKTTQKELSPAQIATITTKSGSLNKRDQKGSSRDASAKERNINMPQNIQNYMDGEHFKQQQRKNREAYKTFSPMLSSTSKSVKNLMQTIKEDISESSINKTKTSKKSANQRPFSPAVVTINQNSSQIIPIQNEMNIMPAPVNVKRVAPSTVSTKTKSGSRKRATKEKIINGKLVNVARKSMDISRVSLVDQSVNSQRAQGQKVRKAGASSRSKSLTKKNSTSQASLMNKHSKKILEKVKSREQINNIKIQQAENNTPSYERVTESFARKQSEFERKRSFMQTDSSELILNDRNYKPIRANRQQLDSSQSYLQVEDKYRNLSFDRRGSKSRSNSSLGRSPYRAHRTQSHLQNSNDHNPQGILKSRSPSKASSPEQQRQQLSSTHSSPYRRSQMEISGLRPYKSRISASPIDSLKKDSVSSHNDPLRSRSRSRSGAPVSNQKDFQVVRDHRGIKRKIEYPSSEDEEPRNDDQQDMVDSLAYSKSIVKHNSKLKLQKVDTPQFEHNRRSDKDLDSKKLDIMQLESSPIRETRPTDKSPSKMLQSSQFSNQSTNLNRSIQMKVTHDRIAKLEQMYEQLSVLEAKAGASKSPLKSSANRR